MAAGRNYASYREELTRLLMLFPEQKREVASDWRADICTRFVGSVDHSSAPVGKNLCLCMSVSLSLYLFRILIIFLKIHLIQCRWTTPLHSLPATNCLRLFPTSPHTLQRWFMSPNATRTTSQNNRTVSRCPNGECVRRNCVCWSDCRRFLCLFSL